MHTARSLVFLCLSFFLTGCLGSSASVPVPEPEPLSPVVAFVAENSPGTSSFVQDNEFGGDVQVTVDAVFLSAAEETCKRATLLSPQYETEIIVICRNPKNTTLSPEEESQDSWRLMPRVWGRTLKDNKAQP